MAINKNHEFEDMNGVKCAVVEKQVSRERAGFLEQLLQQNGYTVVVQPTPATPPPAATEEPPPDIPQTFSVGVTDVMFNPVNAIFGRLLKTADGRVVTLAYWKGKEAAPQDELPYFENRF